jgi:hypothetical protein
MEQKINIIGEKLFCEKHEVKKKRYKDLALRCEICLREASQRRKEKEKKRVRF